ncbi:MAG: fused MFS/spermidine synthase [Pseudomonadales bacterium]|nr:fused MFS/spermidine synthase [Pseudomonadales bacterium]
MESEIDASPDSGAVTALFSAVILTLAFTGGFIIMTIELLGGRILAPYFGSSIYVWGSIITVFMISLSLGYLLVGRLSLVNPSLTRYGTFFLLAAVALLPTIFLGQSIMDGVFLRIEDPRYGSLVASALLFFFPTVVLGMIAPYSVRLLVTHRHHSGQVAGGLYFASTLGSALGTLATSFYLVLYFEVNHILLSMVTILIAAGIIAIGTRFLTGHETKAS